MTHPAQTRDVRALVAVLAIGGSGAALAQTLVVPLIPFFPGLLGASPADATWVVTATLLSGAVASPISGRLADIHGKRTVLIGVLVPVVIGSLICATTSSLWPVVLGRALQGIGVGVIPVGIAALREYVPPARFLGAVALMSSSLGIGGALGLPIAAALAEAFHWQMLFWVSTGVALATMAAFWWVLPRTPHDGPPADADPAAGADPAAVEQAPARRRLDLLGAFLLGGGLVALLLAISRGPTWGVASAATLGCLAAAVALFAVWVWWELRIPQPLVDLRLAAGRTVATTNLASVLVGFSLYVQIMALTQLLTIPAETGHGHGMSLVTMGLVVLPGGLAMPLVAPLGSRITYRSGPRTTLLAGCLVIAAGYVVAILAMSSVVGIVVASGTIGAGIGLAYGAMPALILGAVPHSESGSANSFNAVMRMIGTTTSATVTGIVLAATASEVEGVMAPSLTGFRIALLLGVAAAVGAFVAALFIRSDASRVSRVATST